MKLRVPGLRTLAPAFRSLRTRNYRLFWTGQLISLTGTWMQDVALSWLVLSLTDSPVALGLTMTIRFLPALFLSLHGGVLADRLRKRPTLIATQSVQLVVALTLAVLTSTEVITVALIYLLAGVRGLIEAVEGPTRQAFAPEMVGMADLPNAVALNATLFNGARIFGPAVGAAVISTLGMAACFYINAGAFLATIGALLAMRPSELHLVPRLPRESSWNQLREAFRYVKCTPEVVVIFIVMGFIGTFGYNFQTLLPLIAKYLLQGEASTLAGLTTTMGIGSVAAGLLIAYRSHPTLRLLLGAASAFVFLLIMVGLSSWTVVTTGLLFLAGFIGVLFTTSANTRLQLGVPNHLRGRVMGMYSLLFVGTTPIGSYVIGVLAEYIGVRATVLCMAGLCVVGVASSLLYARRAGLTNVQRGPVDMGQ